MAKGIPAICYALGTLGVLLFSAAISTIHKNLCEHGRKNKFAIKMMLFTCGYSLVYMALAFTIGYEFERSFESDFDASKFITAQILIFYFYRFLTLQNFVFGIEYLESANNSRKAQQCRPITFNLAEYTVCLLYAAELAISFAGVLKQMPAWGNLNEEQQFTDYF